MALYYVNSVLGPERLLPMILFFGEITQPVRVTPSPLQLEPELSIE